VKSPLIAEPVVRILSALRAVMRLGTTPRIQRSRSRHRAAAPPSRKAVTAQASDQTALPRAVSSGSWARLVGCAGEEELWCQSRRTGQWPAGYLMTLCQGRLEIVGQIYAQAFEFRDPTAGQTITTHEGMWDLTRDIRTRTPDIAVLIEEEITEGDAVVHRWTASGHDAATGRSWTAPGISIYHFQQGRIVSEYVVPDRLGLRRQLGMALSRTASGP
jgi:ketosteroid isomerase-like protein